MRKRFKAWFWDHFHPDRKRFLFIRKSRRIDGWITRIESHSPHALEFLERARKAEYVHHPPRVRGSGLIRGGMFRPPVGQGPLQIEQRDLYDKLSGEDE